MDGGRYDARGRVLNVWSPSWRTQSLRDEHTPVGSCYVNGLPERLAHLEGEEGFALADLRHECALLAEKALGAVKHRRTPEGW
jgi:hypothetical protein